MDKAKILDKIKKCLALGKSSNANEAATALRQAQALMRKHGITEAEVEALGYSKETIDIPVQANKTMPAYLTVFIQLMKKAFGVRPVTGRSVRETDTSYTVSYFGPTGRVMTAAYAHTVCWRAMNAEWTKFLKANPEYRGVRGARTGFFIGWIQEVSEKVEAIGFTEDEFAKTEIVIQKTYGRSLSKGKVNNMNFLGDTAGAGREAATNFSIHRPMHMERRRLT